MGFSLWNLLKASVLVLNAIAILHRKRFLARYGLHVPNENPTSIHSQAVGLLNAVQYLKVPLVVVNTLILIVELVLGG